MKQNRFGQASVLSPQHLDNLIDALPAGPHRVLATILRYTDARVSEARLLTWAAISDTHILFRADTVKTRSSREVPLAPQLLDVLKRWKAPSAHRSAICWLCGNNIEAHLLHLLSSAQSSLDRFQSELIKACATLQFYARC